MKTKRFKKKLLSVGTYYAPNGIVNVTRDRLRHWVDQFRRMKESGLNVPVPWGHPNAIPKSRDEEEYWKSKMNAGFASDMEISEDGESLIVEMEIPREEDQDRIGTVVREVSPQIHEVWHDGTGRQWEDVLTHIGLCNYPVEPGQENFEPLLDGDGDDGQSIMRLSLNMIIEEEKMHAPSIPQWRHESSAKYKEKLWITFGPPDELTPMRCIWHDTAGMQWIEIRDEPKLFVSGSRSVSLPADRVGRLMEVVEHSMFDSSHGEVVASADRLLDVAIGLGRAEEVTLGNDPGDEMAIPDWYSDELSEAPPEKSQEMALTDLGQKEKLVNGGTNFQSGVPKQMSGKINNMQMEGEAVASEGEQASEVNNGNESLDRLMELLMERGIEVAPSATADEFVANLLAVLEDTEVPPVDTSDLETETPETVQLRLRQLEQSNSAKDRYIENMQRSSLRDRLQSLCDTGRVTPIVARKLESELGKYQLSIGDNGIPVRQSIESQIELLESYPYGCVWTDEEKAVKMNLQPAPIDESVRTGEEVSEERFREVNRRLNRVIG